MHSPLKQCARLLACSVLFSQINQPSAVQAAVAFPTGTGATGSGVINMRTDLTADWDPVTAGTQQIYSVNCAGNGSTDDTPAIKAAIDFATKTNARYSTPRILYFPNGTYLVTDTIATKSLTGNWVAGVILWGQSQAGTIIKLNNNQGGFLDTLSPKAVIMTGSENAPSQYLADGSGSAQAFRHYIMNLTVDTGLGNVGAIGIEFMANNSGGVRDVTIKSTDATLRGMVGLKTRKVGGEVGPQMIKNVTVIGFEEGVQQTNYDYYTVYENLTLQSQRTRAITARRGNAIIRNLISNNSVQVLSLTDDLASVSIYGATFTGASTGTAISNSGTLLLRDISSSNYTTVVDNLTGTLTDLPGAAGTTTVAEYYSHSPKTAFDTPTHTMDIVPLETPTYDTMDVSTDWVNVLDFGATVNNSSNDDAVGINAAISYANTNNKPIVYLPNGNYTVSQPIVISGSVKKIIGCGAAIGKSGTFSGNEMVRFDATGTVILEHMKLSGSVTHNSTGTLAIVKCNLTSTYGNSTAGTGTTFFEDAQCGAVTITDPHVCYARQLNIETTEICFTNDGGRCWIMGIKTEKTTSSRVLNMNGGILELLGSCFFVNSTPTVPLIENNNGHFGGIIRVKQSEWPTVVRETRGTTTIDKSSSSLFSGTAGVLRVLFSGYTASGPQDDVHIRDGSYATTNFASSTAMEIKAATSSGFTRKGLIKFSLAGKTTTVSSATLELRVVSIDGTNPPTPTSPLTLQLYNVADSWTENAVTWNTVPTLGSLIGTATVTGNNQTVTFTVTTPFNTELTGDKVLSFYLQGASGSNKFISLADRVRLPYTPLLRYTP